MNRLIGLFTTITILFSVHINLPGQTYPDPGQESKLVNDFTGILTVDEIDALEIKLLTFFDSASIHIVVVMVSDLGKTKISEYAKGLYNEWGLGGIENSKGILLLIQTDPPAGIKRAYIEPDSTLRKFIPEKVAAGIISHELLPEFKRGKRFTALSRTADALISIVSGETLPTGQYSGDREKSGPNLITWILIAISALLIIRILITTRRKKSNNPD